MRIQDLFKKEQDKKKFLAQEINMEVTLNNGKKETWKYTLNELINEFTYLKNNIQAVSIFTQAMATEFYKIDPENKFFKDCDEKLISSIKLKIEKDRMEELTSNLKKTLDNLPSPNLSSIDANVLKFPEK